MSSNEKPGDQSNACWTRVLPSSGAPGLGRQQKLPIHCPNMAQGDGICITASIGNAAEAKDGSISMLLGVITRFILSFVPWPAWHAGWGPV